MAVSDDKKDILLGQTIDTIVVNADDNFQKLFDHADEVDETIATKLDAKPNGSKSLIDDEGKIDTAYLPDTVLGQVEYRGTFEASDGTNTKSDTTFEKGYYYICTVAGSKNPDGSVYNDTHGLGTYEVGDWAIFNGNNNGSKWDKVDNTDAVTLVNGQKGSVQTYKGSYTPGTTYYRGDQVLYGECLYLYINETPSTTAPADTSGNYWKIYGRVYSNATTASAGLMSAEDKTKLNDVYDTRHTHSNKTVLDNTTASYTTAEKTKLEGVEAGANKTVVDSTLSTTSTNPVQNKKIKEELDKKVDKVSGKGLSSNDYTSTEKSKLAQIDNSLLGVTADDIGKVKDVKYNGSSILDASGVAVIPTIVIEDLQSEYTTVTANVSKTLNDTTYYGFNVAKTDAAFEVYNSSGQQIVTQKVLVGDNLFIAVGTTSGQSVQIRKLTGGSVTNGAGGANLNSVYPVGSVFQTTVENGYPSVGTWAKVEETVTIPTASVSKTVELIKGEYAEEEGYHYFYSETLQPGLEIIDDSCVLEISGVTALTFYIKDTGLLGIDAYYETGTNTEPSKISGTLSYKITGTPKHIYTRIS